MKVKILRIGKIALPFFVVGLYIACCVDAFIHFNPHSSSASFLSMAFSVLFFVSYLLLLWVFRKNEGILWFSLTVSALSATVIIYNWAQLIYSFDMVLVLLALLAYLPFCGLNLFPFTQQNHGFPWLFVGILVLMFIYELVLLILLKNGFYNKRKRKIDETT